MNKRIAIVGGSCVDIFAASSLPLVMRDSNPGTVSIGFGGVGRNIAENLARLQQDVTLIAVFGSDPTSSAMLAHTSAAGVDVCHSCIVSDHQAPYYISVDDSDGEMAVAVNDMQICEKITPAFLAGKLSVLNRCDAVIVESNIPGEAICYLASHCAPPLFADAVSTRKAGKLTGALPRLHALKVNLQEAQALLDATITAERPSLQNAAGKFHALGIEHVFITLGLRGAYYSGAGQEELQEAFPVKTVNANGCGDAFGAAAFLGILLKRPPGDVLQTALAAAALTARSPQAVSPALSSNAIQTFIDKRS